MFDGDQCGKVTLFYMNVVELLSPIAVHEFIKDYFGKRPLFIAGHGKKSASVFSWHEFNRALSSNRMAAKIRMFKDGESLPSSRYSISVSSDGLVGASKLIELQVLDLLKEGATLIFNGYDDVSESVKLLAHRMEATFQSRVGVNLYAAWKTSRGFKLHWDDHDVFIFQVKGSKRWSVVGESTRFPIQKSIRIPEPQCEPYWEGTLKEGDVLYIPRGWWHVADPIGEETVHLTIGTSNPTGVDMLHWLTTGLASSEVFRKDIPQLADDDERSRYWLEVKGALINTINRPEVLESFIRSWNLQSVPRAFFKLPSGVCEDSGFSDADKILVLPRRFEIEADSSSALNCQRLSFSGKSWPLNEISVEVLSALDANREILIGDLRNLVQGCSNRDFEATLHQLHAIGLINVFRKSDVRE